VSKRDEALCEELKELARRLGIQVREEALLREVGYHVRSGGCRVRGEEVIFLDRTLPPGDRVQVLLDQLFERDFETVYLSPALRALVDGASSPPRSATTLLASSLRPRATSRSKSSTAPSGRSTRGSAMPRSTGR
jgi:hypothetical protein